MSSLNEFERRAFEKAFQMEGGHVFDFSVAKFSSFFKTYGIVIEDPKYCQVGRSKAKRFRSFWDIEDDEVVGRVLHDMLLTAKEEADLGNWELPEALYKRCQKAVRRLLGNEANPEVPAEEEFLQREIAEVAVAGLPIDPKIVPIVERRLIEARTALGAGAHLSVVFLCGSLLEAALIGAYWKDPKKFNQSPSAPKRKGKVPPIADWKLVELINVAENCGVISPDVKQFSHGMRDFRNYIHPAKELDSGFTPDGHTAKLCLQALLAAFADLTGKR